jgi:hypothetical protein
MPTCNRLDLQTIGSQLIMPKNLLNHWHACLIKIFPTMYILPYWSISPPLAICRTLLCYGRLRNLSYV